MAWEDQILYLVLVDRFSDGNEQGFLDSQGAVVAGGTTPPLVRGRDEESVRACPECLQAWRRAGGTWCGGNLRGLTSKLGYLKRLGITTLWISPLLKQAAHASDCYHGYAVQNFLEIDPHLGTAQELQALVRAAHEHGIYVVLDVILNHTGDVFAYVEPQPTAWRPEPYPVVGFRDATGQPTLPFAALDENADLEAAVWPRELQAPECFTRKGPIRDWSAFPEYEEGDFFWLKDLNLGHYEPDETFVPSAALLALIQVYKYWIAYADLDGLRLDTVKHLSEGAVAYFADQIHQFAESIGKLNFYIIGEIVGDRSYASGKLDRTDLDAALGIGEVPEKIREIVQGRRRPADYFQIFANSRREGDQVEDTIWWRNRVVTFFDDHDQVGQSTKSRLGHEIGSDREQKERGIVRAVALQSLTLGIPCLYYGTEQGLDGHVLAEAETTSPETFGPSPDDQLLRECLFGGEFGAFRTQGRHCFDETTWIYQQVAAVHALRHRYPALRRGRQYLRELSEDGSTFWLPEPGEEPYRGLIAWSRLLDVEEFVCVINTDPTAARSAFISLDDVRHGQERTPLRCLYSTEASQIGQESLAQASSNGSAVQITVPPGGTVVFH